MLPYQNLSGHSGVISYETTRGSIRVKFKNGSIYTYTRQSAGERNLAMMKVLATRGRGLSTFISTEVKDQYAACEDPDD